MAAAGVKPPRLLRKRLTSQSRIGKSRVFAIRINPVFQPIVGTAAQILTQRLLNLGRGGSPDGMIVGHQNS